MSLDVRKALIAILLLGTSCFGVEALLAAQQDSEKRVRQPVHRVAYGDSNVRGESTGQQASQLRAVGQADGTASLMQQPQSAQQQSAMGGQGATGRQNPVGQIPATAQRGPVHQNAGYDQPIPTDGAAGIEAIIRASFESEDGHPLDPAIQIAHRSLNNLRRNIHDYQCYMAKRERVNGRLTGTETLYIKVRNEREFEDGRQVPLSIYMRFVEPQSVKGREAIWVSGWNDNRIAAHDAGWKAIFRVNLDPDGAMAMQGTRYPIYDAGIENLVTKLIERAERDRDVGDCKVDFFQGARINDRVCTVIQVTHEERNEIYDFHLAQVFIDNELQVPIRYAAYSWPTREGGSPVLLEEYTYLDIETNVGLTDEDFDPDNPDYDYP